MSHPSPTDSERSAGERAPQPLLWLALIGVVLVCLTLFRGAGTSDVRERARAAVEPPATSEATPLLRTAAAASREAMIARALERSVTLAYSGTTLEDVLADLGRQLDVPIQIDKARLADEGVSLETPMAIRASEIAGRSALHLVLAPQQLAWIVQDEMLLITTQATAAEILETRIYDVTDLVAVADSKGAIGSDMMELVDALKSTVTPDSWDDVGGPGSIQPFDAGGVHSILVRQTQHIHEEIAAVLAGLRRNRRTPVVPTVRAKLPEQRRESPPRQTAFAPMYGTARRSAGSVSPRVEALVRGNNQFALDLYSKLAREKSGNLLISPVGISYVLSILQVGARGETAREMALVQHSLIGDEGLPQAYRALRRESLGGDYFWSYRPGIHMRLDSHIWTQQGLNVELAYREVIQREYGWEVGPIDFMAPAAAATAINEWAQTGTQLPGMGGSMGMGMHVQPIPQVIAERDLTGTTALVAMNIVEFDGQWSQPFHPETTRLALFSAGTSHVEVRMMHNAPDQCRHAVIDGIQVLDKKYGRGDWSMVILLPENTPAALADLEAKLSDTNLLRWLAATEVRFPEVFLPKFQLDLMIELKETLRSLGMKRAFARDEADLSGIFHGGGQALDRIFHKAVVDVREEGIYSTRPAADTETAVGPANPIVFRADHPFLFLVRDNRTGSILFIGRVVNPSGLSK